MRANVMGKLLLFAVVTTLMFGCESKEDKSARYKSLVTKCETELVSECKRACSADPVYAYCALVEGDTLGSGSCVKSMNKLNSSERLAKCESKACGVSAEAWEHCRDTSYDEVYN
jgi:hypothetical protein